MAEKILKGVLCKGCGIKYIPPMNTCLNCGAQEFDETMLANQGEVVSFSDVYRSSMPIPQPFRMIVVKLDDGARVTSRLAEFVEGATEIGSRVEFAEYYDEKTPLFKQI